MPTKTRKPPPYVSVTQFNAITVCGEKYRLSYIEGIKTRMPGKVWGGIALHKAIARAFNAKQHGQIIPLDDLMAVANSTIDAADRSDLPPIWGEDTDTREDVEFGMKASLEHFLAGEDHEGKKVDVFLPHAELIGPAEKRIKFTLAYSPGKTVDVLGYMDLAVKRREKRTVVDWKFTEKWAPSKEVNVQQAIYTTWAADEWKMQGVPFLTVGFCRRKATKRKPLLPRRVEVQQDLMMVMPQDRDWYTRKVIAPAVGAIRDGNFIANPGTACSWCGHRDSCRPSV